jgi:uncharacterized protein YjdB
MRKMFCLLLALGVASVVCGSTKIYNRTQGFKESSWQTNATGNLTGLTANTEYKLYAYATPPPASPPANNFCFNATSLPCATANLSGTTVGTEPNDGIVITKSSPYGVWYTFVGDGEQTTISVGGSTFNHEMGIYSGSCGSLAHIVTIDATGSGGTETYTFTSTIGTNYYVYVAYNVTTGSSTQTGTFTISRTCPNQPAATPTISVQPQGDVTYNQYATATALSVTASVTDGGALTYQWYRNTTNSTTGGTMVGSSSPSGTYTPLTTTVSTTYYYVIVTNTLGAQTATETSTTAKITVSGTAATPAISAQPQSATYHQNTLPTDITALSVTATVSDGSTSLSYQWYSNTTNSTTGGNLISGATSKTYTPSTTTIGTMYYYVIVTNTNGTLPATKTSITATINIVPTPIISDHPKNANYNQGATATALSVTASVSVGGILTYQWYNSGTAISGAIYSTYTPSTAITGYYYVEVKNSVSGTPTKPVTSNTATVTVTPAQLNDQCSTATTLSCGANNLSGTTVGTAANSAAVIVNSSLYGVWYTFVGDGQQTAITSVAGTGFDHAMVIYSGSCGSLTYIDRKDGSTSGGTETYTLATTTSGTRYYVYIAYYDPAGNATQTGTFTISRTCPQTNVPVTGVSLNQTSASFTAALQLTETVLPANATNKSVTWSSDNTSVATVSATGVVTAKAAGTAIITVKTVDGNKTATCAVTVTPSTSYGETLTYSPSTIGIFPPTQSQQIVEITSNVTWTAKIPTEDEGWLSLSPRSGSTASGLAVSGSGSSSFLLTVAANPNKVSRSGGIVIEGGSSITRNVAISQSALGSIPDSVALSPGKIQLVKGEGITLTATVYPSTAQNKSVIWVTDNADVATVIDGRVIGMGVGTTVVRVFTVEGSKTAACSVVVIGRLGNEPDADGSYVSVDNGKLTVSTPAAEQISIYTVGGALLRKVQKASGEATFDLNGLPKGVLIIRGDSGWTRKAVF